LAGDKLVTGCFAEMRVMEIVVLITVIEMAALMSWMIYKYYSRNKQMMPAMPANRSQPHVTSARAPSPAESAHYPFMNERQLEGQRDDRQPMNGVVAAIRESGTSSARAFARRSHQLMYKKWSQERRGE
jgi:hypothetical protein